MFKRVAATPERCDWLMRRRQGWPLRASHLENLTYITPHASTTPTRLHNGEERYVPRALLVEALFGCTLKRADAAMPPGTGLTVHHSEVSHHHGAPHLDGDDGLLPNSYATACSPASEHDEIRSHWYATLARSTLHTPDHSLS